MSVQTKFGIAVPSGGFVALGALLVAACRPPPQPAAATPPQVDSAEPAASDAGALATGRGTEDARGEQLPEEVPIERLIAEPASYFGQRVATAGWVVSCDAGTACGMACGRCGLCSSRTTFVPPGTRKMASCKRNGTSLIIMDPEVLSRFWCHSTSCEDACFRTCPFPAETPVRRTGTIKRATREQIDIGEEQYVFVPDPM